MADVLAAASTGTHLITDITKYLSTLPHPIEIVEELVAVCAVTASLLTSLHDTFSRFPTLELSPTHSFLGPLCHDVLFAFKQLEERVEEAKKMRVFEPNDVGLVRLPRAAWVLVMGTEAKTAALRSRLYVEKYRVRVLIEAVCWVGLSTMKANGQYLNPEQEDELKLLVKMLPLIAERLVGVQKDYAPRLNMIAGGNIVEEFQQEKGPEIVVTEKEFEEEKKDEDIKEFEKPSNGKKSFPSSPSMDSLASSCSTSSSVTVIDDSIQEIWVLRRDEPTKDVQSTHDFFGLKYYTSHKHVAASYYVKAVSSSVSEIKDHVLECQGQLTESEYQPTLHKKVLDLEDLAQWEIQRLIENREKASSTDNIKRSWEVVALQERPRRKICPITEKKWYKKSKKPLIEWLLVLKGETVDQQSRITPTKHDNPWNPKPKPGPAPIQRRIVNSGPPPPVAAPAGTVLRHVENRRVVTVQEAEKKMQEIVRDLFKYQGEDQADFDTLRDKIRSVDT